MATVRDRADFSFVRYAQCWEDADILLTALDVKPGAHYVSIASGGENSFAIASLGARVTAIDLSPSQLAVTALKMSAYHNLSYGLFLEFIGVRPCMNRLAIYHRLRADLTDAVRDFWENHPDAIRVGIIHAGKFERYFHLFRQRVLPLIHSDRTVDALLSGHATRAERERFYSKKWDNLRYRTLFSIFFSRYIMGKQGRDPEFFKYVEGSVADRIRERVGMGLIEVNPAENPYLHYILKGNYGDALPYALREENFEAVKANLSGITLIESPLEEFLGSLPDSSVMGYNLSDIFEYMSPEAMDDLYATLLNKAAPGCRLAYWNMLAPRSHNPDRFGGEVIAQNALAEQLHRQDKAPFYSKFVVEERL